MSEDVKSSRDDLEAGAHEEAPASSVRFDAERYLPMTEDFDLTEAEKREFLETLWNLLVTLADLGLGLDPVQMLLGTNSETATRPSIGTVNSDHPKRDDFQCAAALPDGLARKK